MTTRTVSVITPVHAASVGLLRAACDSLRAQVMPPGWDWQWLVQEDGEDGLLDAARLPSDDRISAGAGRRGGPGVARTLALARADGQLVKVLDADDLLAPGVLSRDVQALADASIGWTTSRALDLLPDASTLAQGTDPPSGALPRGSVLRHWLDHDHRLPVHPATLCIRRDLVVALGGWMALPASEDTGLLLAASAVADGWFCDEVGLLYRRWEGQVTGQGSHSDPAELAARRSVIGGRAQALARWTAC